MSYEKSVSLHQQDGSMSLRSFAQREGLDLHLVKRYAKNGWILGARQDARSKHWHIYPPAKLLRQPRSYKWREAPEGFSSHITDEAAALRLPVHPTEAQEGHAEGGILEGGRCTITTEDKAEGKRPPAGLVLGSAALPVADERTEEHVVPARRSKGVYAESRSVCQMLHDAAKSQFRKGLHYLRLDAHEFAQLYAALDCERSRVRKLVGRGLLPVGLLRASDSVWQKMQAMSREGKLL